MFNKMLKSLSLCFIVTLSTQAYAEYLNISEAKWGIDFDGSANGTSIQYISTFDYTGYSVVKITDSDGSNTVSKNDTFTEFGYLDDVDSSVRATFSNWTGRFNETTNISGVGDIYTYEFDTGPGVNTMSWDTGAGSLMNLDLIYGLGIALVNDQGLIVNNSIDFQLAVTDIAIEDFFFMEIDGVVYDMKDIVDGLTDYDGLVYAFTTTTAKTSQLSDADITLLASLSGYSEDDITDYINSNNDLLNMDFISYNDGYIDFGVVPEPGMLGLMGLSFLGFAGFQSRRKGQRKS